MHDRRSIEQVNGAKAGAKTHKEGPHLLTLVYGLFDAHLSQVDYLDTAAGRELGRLYRQHKLAQQGRSAGGDKVA